MNKINHIDAGAPAETLSEALKRLVEYADRQIREGARDALDRLSSSPVSVEELGERIWNLAPDNTLTRIDAYAIARALLNQGRK